MSGFITLQVVSGITGHYTLSVREEDWLFALEKTKASELARLSGNTGGRGCQGEILPIGQSLLEVVSFAGEDGTNESGLVAKQIKGDLPEIEEDQTFGLFRIDE